MGWKESDLVVDLDPPDEECPICISSLQGDEVVVELSRCNHHFHRKCVTSWFRSRPSCPTCLRPYGIFTGTQPRGSMFVQMESNWSCAGFPLHGVITINYHFPNGIQGPEHPNPGHHYKGTVRTAFLPDNEEGRDILRLLKIAWKRRLVFTVGTSITTGLSNCVIWNGIHHKTQYEGTYGYPDATYLSRVRQELAALGVF
ncbi:hypothetical protein SELMODRAFT_119112 [Selaginella moellendorffii]|uniref:RING-type E3 ubiquitin transferase n=1 Tax=Selaginella moellendorffii TaxID=88036 RepID=D8SKI6_SELML|nr:hypothetical protein SELMODRAFT_119112 [Selaginella moellendorffii]